MSDAYLQQELDSFLKAYEKAANSTNFDNVDPLITDDAIFIFTDGTHEGKVAIRRAFEDTWKNIQSEKYKLSNIKWMSKDIQSASCTYRFRSDGIVNGEKQVYEGHGTNILVKDEAVWRIAHEHLSMEARA